MLPHGRFTTHSKQSLIFYSDLSFPGAVHFVVMMSSGGAYVPPLTGVFTEHACLKSASTAAISACGAWTDFSLLYVRSLATLCQAGYSELEIVTSVEAVCRVDM